jgi:L-lactate dehydrogenase complex protein LldE
MAAVAASPLQQWLSGDARVVGLQLLRAAQPHRTIVAISGSCTAMVQHYLPTMFDGTKRLGADSIGHRFTEFASYVANHPNLDRLGLKLDGAVAYHDSCHARRELGLTDTVAGLLSRIQGLDVRRLEHEEECCGFGGSFSVKLPEISAAMMTAKLGDLQASGARVLVSTDLSCLAHLEAGARGLGMTSKCGPSPSSSRGRSNDGLRARGQEIANEQPAHLSPIFRKLVGDSAEMLARGPGDARARAQAARAHAVLHLEELHARVQEQVERRDIGYHRCATAEEAVAKVRELLGDARRVAKSKTMVGEEIGLTHALRVAGIDVLETDIGEYIVDIEGRGPSHITAPALHLNRSRIRDLLARTGADLPDDDPLRLSLHVRDAVGVFFADCDAGITGATP